MSGFPNQVSVAGKRFTLKELALSDMFDLVEAAGTATGNAAWMYMATRVCSVTAIDGVPVVMPTTKADVKRLADKIGTEAYAEIDRQISESGKAEAAADDPTVKNSPGTRSSGKRSS